jgi:hypothetical protein
MCGTSLPADEKPLESQADDDIDVQTGTAALQGAVYKSS